MSHGNIRTIEKFIMQRLCREFIMEPESIVVSRKSHGKSCRRRPLCVHGSLHDAVSKIAGRTIVADCGGVIPSNKVWTINYLPVGKKREYWFEDDLIKRNLKTTINSYVIEFIQYFPLEYPLVALIR